MVAASKYKKENGYFPNILIAAFYMGRNDKNNIFECLLVKCFGRASKKLNHWPE